MTREGIVFKKPFKRKILLNKGRESVLCALNKEREKHSEKTP